MEIDRWNKKNIAIHLLLKIVQAASLISLV